MSEALTYDPMGNITTLSRDAGAAGTYNYTGNRLTGITGGPLATATYAYDANGNATTDGRTGVTLTYNTLNLPVTAVKGTTVNLTYTYDATGRKLRKTSSAAPVGTRHYIDGIEYNGNTLDIIHTDEGVARNNGGSYSYEYNLRDHLGNVRYTFNKNPSTGVLTRLQQDNYYPFGMQKLVSAGPNKYLYNGKELQSELGQLDYGARFYDPLIGRWSVMDPLAEEFDHMTAYNYGMNNPMRFVDPDGMQSVDQIDPPGKPIQLEEVVIKSGKNKGLVAYTAHSIFGEPYTAYRLPRTTQLAMRAEINSVFTRFTPLGRAISVVDNILSIAERSTLQFAKPKKKTPINQLAQLVKRGKAPKTIKRFDKGNPNNNEDDHVHFDNGSALYQDGTWKHGFKNLTNSEKQFLNNAGWTIP